MENVMPGGFGESDPASNHRVSSGIATIIRSSSNLLVFGRWLAWLAVALSLIPYATLLAAATVLARAAWRWAVPFRCRIPYHTRGMVVGFVACPVAVDVVS